MHNVQIKPQKVPLYYHRYYFPVDDVRRWLADTRAREAQAQAQGQRHAPTTGALHARADAHPHQACGHPSIHALCSEAILLAMAVTERQVGTARSDHATTRWCSSDLIMI